MRRDEPSCLDPEKAYMITMRLPLSDLIKETPTLLEAKYIIEIVDGQIIETSHILKGCKLELAGLKLDIDLMPVTLGSFDVIVGMDWLSKNQAEVICSEKIVRIPLPSEKNSSRSRRKGWCSHGHHILHESPEMSSKRAYCYSGSHRRAAI
ncbi:hypothetical protein L1987_80653 [Smallanthus sonchifolius]|uniref:Uncharacterized protein n=1 Tax=Smallanthus sonchifolius TaxID=185202 RepID=A0ACB8YNU1_9ASTR|nr:hypothetical protein L1987_80653 [Smallanthus sonchifolius]